MRWALLSSLLVVAGGMAAAQPAQAYYVWQQRELTEDITFSGEFDSCKPGDYVDPSEDRHDQPIPGPARAVRIVAPRVGTALVSDRRGVLGSFSITSAFVTATTPNDQVVHITARAWVSLCVPTEVRWKTKDVELKVKYEQLVYTPIAPVVDCSEPFVTIHKLQAQRVSCAYAVALSRRYLVRARTLARRKLPPYTCLERLQGSRRSVYCYAAGRRNVRFRYGL